MSSIDERIVSMQFDNDQFEKNVGTTLKSLTNLENSVDGINGISTSGLSDALDTLQDRFSNLGIVGMTVLQNLTNRFIDAGINMAKSLTIDQVAEGFDKYTANTKTVKALLNSTGESIDVVTDKINGLSWYSDATSYSYNSMVSALKSFTAQDIKMDEAIPAIMGIGNSLSYAGLAAEEASYAFDIYSKAIGQGYLANQHLRSLNNMGAVTANWKQQMIDAAVEVGTLKKVSDGLYKTQQDLTVSIQEFDMTLGHQKGKWLTREVMMKVFGDVYGDYTQRLQAFMAEEENAGLTIDQAIKKFNELNGITEDFGLKAFKSAQEARTFSEAIGAVRDAASSAWRGIFENVFGNAEEATLMWTSFSDWLYDVFMGPSELMYDMSAVWNNLGGRDSLLQGFANLAEALHSFAQPIKDAFHAVFGPLTSSDLGEKLKDLTDKFASLTEKLTLNSHASLNVRRIFEGLFSVAAIIKKAIGDVAEAFGYLFEHIKPLGGKLLDAAGAFGKWLSVQRPFLTTKDNLLLGFAELTVKAIEFVQNAKPIEWIFTNVKNLAEQLWGKLKELGAQLKKTFEPITDNHLNFENILKLIAAIGGAATLKVGVFDRLKNLGSLPSEIGNAVSIALKSIGDTMRDWAMLDLSMEQMRNLALAIAALAVALMLIASIDTDKLMGGLVGMGAVVKMMEMLISQLAGLSINPTTGFGMSQVALSFIKIAASIVILAEAVKMLSGLNFEELIKGIAGVGAVMFELYTFAKSMKGIEIKPSTGTAMILIAGALLLMSKGVEALGTLEIEVLKQGLIAIAALLAEIAVFSNLMNPEGILETSVSMVALGAAILIMAEGIERMGSMPFEIVMQGLVGIAAGLTVLGIALELIPSNLGAAASIAILSTSMIALAAAFAVLGQIPFEGIGKALLAIIPTLTTAFVLFKFLDPITTLAVAAALTIFAAALNLLIPPFVAFGVMPLDNIGKALLVIVGALGTFGLMAALLQAVVVPMLALAAAMALFGVGVASFAAGMATLAVAGVAATASFIGSLELWLVAIPMLATSLLKAFTALLQAFCGAVKAAVPDLLDTLDYTIFKVLEFLIIKIPVFVDMGSQVVIAFLDGLAAKMPELVEAAINFIAVFIESLANSLETHKEQLIRGIDNLILNIFDIVWGAITGLIKGIGDRIPDIWKKGVEFIGGFLMGIVEKGAEINKKMWDLVDQAGIAIAEKFDRVKQWGTDLFNKIREGLTQAIENAVTGAASIGKNLVQGFLNGLSDSTLLGSVLSKAGGIASSVLNKFKGIFRESSPSKEMADIGKYVVEGLQNGMADNEMLAVEAATTVGDNTIEAFRVALGTHSESYKTHESGYDTVLGLANSLTEYSYLSEQAATQVGENTISAFDDSLDGIENVLPDNLDSEYTVYIKADTTDAEAGIGRVNTMLADTSKLASLFYPVEDPNLPTNANYWALKESGALKVDPNDKTAFPNGGIVLNEFAGTVMDLVTAAEHGFLSKEALAKNHGKIIELEKEGKINVNINQNFNNNGTTDADQAYRGAKNGTQDALWATNGSAYATVVVS